VILLLATAIPRFACAEVTGAGSVALLPTSAHGVKPLLTGQPFPDAILRDTAGQAVSIRSLQPGGRPLLIIFYRGGWCRVCVEQLVRLQSLQAELGRSGVSLVAISPDRPEKGKETVERFGLGYPLLADSTMDLARKVGIAYQLDQATATKFKNEYKVDLEGASGETHHQLPVASAFLLDRAGKIYFSYVNPDSGTRVDPELLLTAARLVNRTGSVTKPGR
jgi:peroxiredoxin